MDEEVMRLSLQMQVQSLSLMEQILEELKMLRQATEQANEPSQDDEPDPYQTLNGPSKDCLEESLKQIERDFAAGRD